MRDKFLNANVKIMYNINNINNTFELSVSLWTRVLTCLCLGTFYYELEDFQALQKFSNFLAKIKTCA